MSAKKQKSEETEEAKPAKTRKPRATADKSTASAPAKKAKAAKKEQKAEKKEQKAALTGKVNRQKTFIVKPHEFKHEWFILDATGKTLGRLACEIAKILRGKHKPTFTTFADAGDGVIVVNAEKVRVTGNKEAQKIYRYHTGSMSGMREIPYRTMLARKPTYIIENAVKGMMPQSRLAEAQLKRLRVFAGTEHNMDAQKPVQVNI